MILEEACKQFCDGVSRDELANNAHALVEVLQDSLREGFNHDVSVHLFQAIVKCRLESVEQTLLRVRAFMHCDSLSLLDFDQWDPMCMLLFVCECQCRACLIDSIPLTNWPEFVIPEGAALYREMVRTEVRIFQEEIKKGIIAKKPSAYIHIGPRMPRAAISLSVCFDKVVEFDDDLPYGKNSCITRRGVRLIERRCLIENIREMIAFELSVLEETQINEDEAREVAIKAWAQKNILFDGNNTLLLRLDEWALCCMLEPYDVVWASGERGGVPQEHRNTPGVWVAQNSKSDAEYRRLMTRAKKNEEHVENTYVCFSAMLEQHFNFDWLERCFVARINPQVALKKIRKYLSCANSKTPPLVIQTDRQQAKVVWFGGFAEASTPERAIDIWLQAITQMTRGAFTRKADVKLIWDRINQQSENIIEKDSQLSASRISLPNI